jgi:hypothetical protein
MRSGVQPGAVGLPEKPQPGSDGITRWKASDALPPCAAGLVSGSMIFSCSMTRARPSVRDDERQRILMWRTDVDEMDIQAGNVEVGIGLVVAAGPVFLAMSLSRL